MLQVAPIYIWNQILLQIYLKQSSKYEYYEHSDEKHKYRIINTNAGKNLKKFMHNATKTNKNDA